MNIGKTLKELMEDRGLSIKQLSAITEVPQTTLREWCLNRPPKNPVQVQRVAKALGVSMHFLYFGMEDEQVKENILREEFFQGVFEISIKKLKYK